MFTFSSCVSLFWLRISSLSKSILWLSFSNQEIDWSLWNSSSSSPSWSFSITHVRRNLRVFSSFLDLLARPFSHSPYTYLNVSFRLLARLVLSMVLFFWTDKRAEISFSRVEHQRRNETKVLTVLRQTKILLISFQLISLLSNNKISLFPFFVFFISLYSLSLSVLFFQKHDDDSEAMKVNLPRHIYFRFQCRFLSTRCCRVNVDDSLPRRQTIFHSWSTAVFVWCLSTYKRRQNYARCG